MTRSYSDLPVQDTLSFPPNLVLLRIDSSAQIDEELERPCGFCSIVEAPRNRISPGMRRGHGAPISNISQHAEYTENLLRAVPVIRLIGISLDVNVNAIVWIERDVFERLADRDEVIQIDHHPDMRQAQLL